MYHQNQGMPFPIITIGFKPNSPQQSAETLFFKLKQLGHSGTVYLLTPEGIRFQLNLSDNIIWQYFPIQELQEKQQHYSQQEQQKYIKDLEQQKQQQREYLKQIEEEQRIKDLKEQKKEQYRLEQQKYEQQKKESEQKQKQKQYQKQIEEQQKKEKEQKEQQGEYQKQIEEKQRIKDLQEQQKKEQYRLEQQKYEQEKKESEQKQIEQQKYREVQGQQKKEQEQKQKQYQKQIEEEQKKEKEQQRQRKEQEQKQKEEQEQKQREEQSQKQIEEQQKKEQQKIENEQRIAKQREQQQQQLKKKDQDQQNNYYKNPKEQDTNVNQESPQQSQHPQQPQSIQPSEPNQFQEQQYSNKSQENLQQQNKNNELIEKNKRQQKIYQIINEINQRSSNLRVVEENYKKYIQGYHDRSELVKEYNVKKLLKKQELYKYCNGYIQVRGDGNCFYTAFGYQFIRQLLFTYKNDEFNSFINKIKNINLRCRIQLKGFKIDDLELEKQILDQFIYQLQQLRNIEDIEKRKEELLSQFSEFSVKQDGTGFLYTLSTIFFRNLSDYLVEQDQETKANIGDDQQSLLIWETECNSNEPIINQLAKYLDLNILLIFFDKEDFIIRQYEEKNKNQIILLIRPGHYNIGIQN